MEHIITFTRRIRLFSLLALGILVLLVASPPALARERTLPPSFTKGATLRPLALVDRQNAPTPDIEAILAEEAANQEAARQETTRRDDGKAVTLQFAAPQPLPLSLAQAATWDTLPTGERLARLRLVSAGARSINLSFSRFELTGEAGLWIYSLDGAQVHGPFRASDAKNGRLWSPVVVGEEVVVELVVPDGATAEVELETVNHGFRTFGAVPVKQSACHIDTICPEGNPYRDQIRAVGRYTLNGILLCTGTLVNNTALDRKPLFLTADHCGITTNNAASMVVYWNYESPTCGALSGGNLADNQAGSKLLARLASSDFALVELDAEPADSFDVYYAGWDATGNVPQKSVLIHHPSLDEKALSFENEPVVSEDIGSGGQTHWKVRDWDVGSTEGGSSGGCLFDQASKRCVGTLTGGFASCANNLEDYFGKLSRHWVGAGNTATRLSSWLDPIGAISSGQPLVLDGLDPDNCVRNDTTACLANGRFEVRVRWRDAQGQTGFGKRKEIDSNSSVLFWFFNPDNVEFLVKVLDACSLNQRFWVFGAASTDVEYTLEVTDKEAGDVVKTYFNPLGTASPAITDIQAFATCN